MISRDRLLQSNIHSSPTYVRVCQLSSSEVSHCCLHGDLKFLTVAPWRPFFPLFVCRLLSAVCIRLVCSSSVVRCFVFLSLCAFLPLWKRGGDAAHSPPATGHLWPLRSDRPAAAAAVQCTSAAHSPLPLTDQQGEGTGEQMSRDRRGGRVMRPTDTTHALDDPVTTPPHSLNHNHPRRRSLSRANISHTLTRTLDHQHSPATSATSARHA